MGVCWVTFVEAHPANTAKAKKIDITRLRVIIANLLFRLALQLVTFGRDFRDFSGARVSCDGPVSRELSTVLSILSLVVAIFDFPMTRNFGFVFYPLKETTKFLLNRI
jgi:hypothetical protein